MVVNVLQVGNRRWFRVGECPLRVGAFAKPEDGFWPSPAGGGASIRPLSGSRERAQRGTIVASGGAKRVDEIAICEHRIAAKCRAKGLSPESIPSPLRTSRRSLRDDEAAARSFRR
jgi:hypothetical protein